MEKFFVNIPYPMLCARTEEVVARRLFLEIEFGPSALDRFNKKEAKRIASRLHDEGLQNTMHGPFKDLSPGSPDSKVRDLARERFHKTLEAAEILKPECVVFHSGYYRQYDHHENQWLKNSLVTWKPVVQRAQEIGTILAVENEYDRKPDTLLSLIEGIGSPRFRHCLDVGHLNMWAETSMDQWVKAMAPYIVELHLHDNKGERDEHLPIGIGNIDFSGLVRLIHKYVKDQPLYTLEPAREEDLEANILGFKRFFANNGETVPLVVSHPLGTNSIR